jgi:hypothetical protein
MTTFDLPQLFCDDTNPDNIPSWVTHAALYFDGDFGAAGRAAGPRFAFRRWITVTGDYAHCGIADYEPKNPVYDQPGALHDWAAGRDKMGKPARVYCDRDDLERAQAETAGLPVWWWIATLDGNMLHPGWVPGLWAVQFCPGADGNPDTSIRYMDRW